MSSFCELVHILELKDNEVVLIYENGNFKDGYGTGKYVFWKSLIDCDFKTFGLDTLEVPESLEQLKQIFGSK